jgi:hypothetical protein
VVNRGATLEEVERDTQSLAKSAGEVHGTLQDQPGIVARRLHSHTDRV